MPTILIADDSTTIRKVVQSVLGAAGHSVLGAVHGREALELARSRRPDLVLCDVLMPELTGYEVAEALKRDPALQSIPIVLLFGAFEPFDEDRAARCGAVGHMAKPFDPRQLLRRVEEVLIAFPAAPAAPTVVLERAPDTRTGATGPEREPAEAGLEGPPAGAAPSGAIHDFPLELPPPPAAPWEQRVPLPGEEGFDLAPPPLEDLPPGMSPDLAVLLREEVRRRLAELAPEIVREVAWEVVPDLLERLLRENAPPPPHTDPTGDKTR